MSANDKKDLIIHDKFQASEEKREKKGILFDILRDESFITSWGGGEGGYIQRVDGNFFGDALSVCVCGGGGENKMTYGRGMGSCISSGMGGGGADVFHWSFFH